MKYYVRIKNTECPTLDGFCKRNRVKTQFIEHGWMSTHKNTSVFSLKMKKDLVTAFKLSFPETLIKI